MRNRTIFSRLILLLMALSLVAAACGDDDPEETPDAGTDTTGGGGDEELSGGEFTVQIGEPEHLFPTNTNESEGSQVLEPLFTGLVSYDSDTSQPVNQMAESIESDDQTVWTITIEDGWTFHNGDPVTAQDYVDSWTFGANAANAQGNAGFYSKIDGYDALQCGGDGSTVEETGECITPPTETELSGLRVVDELTFEVTLSAPFSQFPLILGYNPFFAMPAEALTDPETYENAPIGTGPYKIDGAWQRGEQIRVTRYDDYAGDNKGNADAVTFRIYSEVDTAFLDLQAGDLDVVPQVPVAEVQNAKEEFGDRFVERPDSGFSYLGFPLYDARFEDPRLRQAFSLAIDRETIISEILNGSVEPARSVISPVVAGSRDDACEFCEYDPERAKELYDDAGGYEGTLNLWFNSGADHEAWMEAISNQLRENLGIETIESQTLDFAEYLPLLDEKGVDGPFRLAWGMDYPSPQNYLEPLYSQAAQPPNGSNAVFYANDEFDALVQEGNEAGSIEDGIESYQAAEDLLLEDMPVIPLWFDANQVAHSENIDNVVVDAFGLLRVAGVEVVT